MQDIYKVFLCDLAKLHHYMQKTCIRNPFLDVFSESKIDQGEASIVLALYKNPV